MVSGARPGSARPGPRPDRATPSRLARATAALSAADPIMAGLVARHGPCLLTRPSVRGGEKGGGGYFAALAESVLYQQLAGSAAAAIHRRFMAAVGGSPTPAAVVAAGEDALRSAGLSRSKALTILGMAEAVLDGSLDLDALASGTDQEVVDGLVGLRGIGPWTAHMFCIFSLGRLDIWPVTDYGVRKGYAQAYRLTELPSPRALDAAGEPFRPQRSVAAWYLWRAAESP